MATTFTDQFYILNPLSTPAVGTPLVVHRYTVVDNNGNGVIARTGGDTINGSNITETYTNSTLTITQGGTTTTITGTYFHLHNGSWVFSPTDGSVLHAGTFTSSTTGSHNGTTSVASFGPPCFTPGTLIAVPGGAVAVEALAVGDAVVTLDHGPQAVRWIGRQRVDGTGALAPVRFETGALGNSRPLLVSPQHRMLVTGWRAEVHFATDRALVAARHLAGLPGVAVTPMREVEYIHVMFDRHEIVLAEGIPSESFHPGGLLAERDPAVRAEILAVFPELAEATPEALRAAAQVLTGAEARILHA